MNDFEEARRTIIFLAQKLQEENLIGEKQRQKIEDRVTGNQPLAGTCNDIMAIYELC